MGGFRRLRGVRMITRADRALYARIAMRHDTAMSRAMLRALDIGFREPRPPVGCIVSADKYAGVLECFRNPRSPMDW